MAHLQDRQRAEDVRQPRREGLLGDRQRRAAEGRPRQRHRVEEQFGDFEFELEWNIGNASNSGVFYRGTDAFNQIYWSAPEYQLLDNVNAADNKQDNHLAGSVYDLLAAPKDAVKPAGEWNQTRIVAKGTHVEHWLNGKKVASYDVGSPEWEAAIKASKFKPEKYPDFGRAPKGYLGIQGDHPGTLKLRNIRIRELT
jgi:hypothetical protein